MVDYLKSDDLIEDEFVFVNNIFQENIEKITNSPKQVSIALEEYAPTLRGFSTEKIETCLGEFGLHIVKLIEYFNLRHSSLRKLLDLFTPLVISKLQEVFDIYEDAIEFDAIDILKFISNSINESTISKELDKILDEKIPLRALKSSEVREDFRRRNRLCFTSNTVDFSEFECDYSAWMQCPTSLQNLIRLNEEHLDAGYCHDVIHKFSQLGMDEQANMYSRYLTDSLKKKDKYFGFQKVDLKYLASILAKINGFVPNNGMMSLYYENNPEFVSFLLSSLCFSNPVLRYLLEYSDKSWNTNNPTIYFDAINKTNVIDWESAIKYYFRKNSVYNFKARLYSVADPLVRRLLSSETLKIIEKLDNFHDNEFSPLFDCFFFLLPSIAMQESAFYNDSFNSYNIYDGKILRTFGGRKDAMIFLDFLLIENGISVPVLIGQKDDQFYVINYCI